MKSDDNVVEVENLHSQSHSRRRAGGGGCPPSSEDIKGREESLLNYSRTC